MQKADKIKSTTTVLKIHLPQASGGKQKEGANPTVGFPQIRSGSLELVEIIKGCHFAIVDIRPKEDLLLEISGFSENGFQTYFCLEGSVLFSFKKDKSFKMIGFRQNVIAKKPWGNTISLLLRQNVELKLICSFFNVQSLKSSGQDPASIPALLLELARKFSGQSERFHLGRTCSRTSEHAGKVFEDISSSSEQKIYRKSALLIMAASQLERAYSDTVEGTLNLPIPRYDLDKVLATSKFIEDNLAEDLTLDRLRWIAGISNHKLQLGFKYLYDKTVASYILNARIEKAAELLQNTEMNISEAVYEVGLTSRSYFSKKFFKRFGMSPSVLKKKYHSGQQALSA